MKNYIAMINNQIIDIIYNQINPPYYPPTQEGLKIKIIEDNFPNIDKKIGMYYDSQLKTFKFQEKIENEYIPLIENLKECKNEELFPNITVDKNDILLINKILDNYTLELIENGFI